MKTRILKVGKRFVIPIPVSLVNKATLRAGELMEVTLAQDRLIVERSEKRAISLSDLLTAVTEDNRPIEWNTGPQVGRESW